MSPSLLQRFAAEWSDIDRTANGNPLDDEEAAFAIGRRDGFQEAVQWLDRLTGGDGEYRYCLPPVGDRHCPTPVEMAARIVERVHPSQGAPIMTPEPSNEYQKLVEAVARAITEEIGWGSFSHFNPDDLRRISLAALSALKLPHAGDDGWQDIAELKPKFGEVLGWADGCGYEVVRCHSDGHRYAGSFTAD